MSRPVLLKELPPPPASGFLPDEFEKRKDEQGNHTLTEVTKDNSPKIYNALIDECNFRNIPIPACYVDKAKNQRGGEAFPYVHAIAIDSTQVDLKKLSIAKDPRYPSFADRMKYMKDHIDTLGMGN